MDKASINHGQGVQCVQKESFLRISLVLGLAMLAGAAIISAINWQTTSFNFITGPFEAPIGLVTLVCLLVGSFVGCSTCLNINRKSPREEKVSQWQAQDAKLLTTIASDKERHLEAKVATLEAALKTALKRQNN